VPAVIVTAGPGATNAVTGIASAHVERVPMLVICGDVAWSTNGGRLLQDSGPEGLDVEQMLARFMRATVRVARPQSAATQGLAALHAAIDPAQPGPALLVVPIQHGSPAVDIPRVARGSVLRTLVPPRDAAVETHDVLLRAERPLIVLGAACRPWADEVLRLIERLDVPFVTTPRAKGIVSEEHPLSLRHGGLAASMWARRYTSQGIDGTLVLGTDLDDCSVGPTPYTAPGGKLIHVDTDATVFNRNLQASLSVLSDIGAFIATMSSVVMERGLRRGTSGEQLLGPVKSESAFDRSDYDRDEASVIAPHRAIADLERAAPEARFITDIGEHMLFALHYLTAKGPHAFDIRLGLGSMGSGITTAIGLAIGDRTRRVICICGDGGMQMAGMEVMVALQLGLPIVFAVFNDARYNMVYHGYRQVFGREAPWESPWVDFVAWAESLGIPGARVDCPGEITPELLERLGGYGGPTILDIRIDRDVRIAGGGRNEALLHMSMGGK
jgi:acetolactate synthase-1/2/3 large subunit